MSTRSPGGLLPPSHPPVRRGGATTSPLPQGLLPSGNAQLQCELCCQAGGGAHCAQYIPGCNCALQDAGNHFFGESP